MPQASFLKEKRDPNGDYSAEFERVWSWHPRGGKRTAFKAFLKACPKKITIDELEKKLGMYVQSLADGFRGAHLSTWLNGEHWESNLGGTGKSGYKPPRFYEDGFSNSGLTPIKNPLKRTLDEAADEAGT